ncbi:hypothetical protein [Persicirhabdus sediminis]|uniref:Hydrazine synthase alpha subunit middle domain-containing protein n=1 Tax=Persicirhabdus sediminis TaxID=454144 RepID=A0A8J7MBN5_9BACT|nr:hypothetical protein [Persicirhabdus sediminis]MBK1790026.1 hypothetical protein [Persicirhabdus sediminis]
MKKKYALWAMSAMILAVPISELNAAKNNDPIVIEAPKRTMTKASLKASILNLIDAYGAEYPHGKAFLKQLESIDDTQEALNNFAVKALAAENPLLKDKDILFVERPQYPKDHHNTGNIFQKGEINEKKFLKMQGSELKVLSLDTNKEKTIFRSETGAIRDPEVHFSGEKLVFSYRENIDDDYSIYEMNVDGSSMKQLTSLAGVSDIDPFYLSDGKIAFSSTREPKFCTCNRHIMANIYKMDSDGANILQIGKSLEFEGHGIQMPDGRLLYNRWEYVDRNFGGAQGLWTSNPDGTNPALYMWQSTPHPLLNARPIPGSNKLIAIISSCHDKAWGALAILDRNRGVEGSETVVKIWPEAARALIADESQDYSGSGGFDNFRRLPVKYEDPLPLSKNYFLVSRSIGDIANTEVAMFLIDMFGNEVMLAKSDKPGGGYYDPMPIQKYEKPALLADKTDLSKTEGTFLIMNVYEGSQMEGVAPGSIKWLRVVDNPPKMNWTYPEYQGQGTQSPAMNFHDFDNKRVMATIPVEEDGSVQFTVPSDKFIYLQLLDEEGKMIQSMRSGMVAQPGEVNSCIGCHYDRDNAPPPHAGKLSALSKPPYKITEETAETEGNFSYQALVQPIFDKHCLSCHDYDTEGGEKLLLCGDLTETFSISYLELHKKKYISTVGGGANKVYGAYEWGSAKSKLIEILDQGHEGVKLSAEEYHTLLTWIDLNAPYYPDYSSAYPEGAAGRSPLTLEEFHSIEGIRKRPFGYYSPTYVNFTRPERSPVLKKLEANDKEHALALIRKGAEKLKQTPRNDMPGYKPSAEDQRRLDRYDELVDRELQTRRAIQKGMKVYDPGIGEK